MAPLNQSEKDEIVANVLQELSPTPYACSSLVQLTSGTTNFVFRGVLSQSLSVQGQTAEGKDGLTIDTVIIKHSATFAALNKDLPIDVSRCITEESMLLAMGSFSYVATAVKVPRLYLFNRETNTQVLEDIPGVIDLQTFLVERRTNGPIPKSLAISIGHALGAWLRAYHSWTSLPSQCDIRAKIGNNDPMRRLKYQISYDSFIQVLEQFPEVLGDAKETLEEVRDMAKEEFQNTIDDEQGNQWGLIHGDFWTGNVLLPELQLSKEVAGLFIIDWEFAQVGHRSYDIGQMIGDMYERKHFRDIESALWALEAFIEGYGIVSEDMAYRIAIHAGVQLITWVNRGPPLHLRPAWATRDRIISALEMGKALILRGWKKDEQWLRSSILSGLFKI